MRDHYCSRFFMDPDIMPRPPIPKDQKNILACFSITQAQARRLKDTKRKSKLIQHLLNTHFEIKD